MSRNSSSHPAREPREARLEMTHGACGGKGDLTVVHDLNNVICLVHCYDCGYVGTWLADPGTAVERGS